MLRNNEDLISRVLAAGEFPCSQCSSVLPNVLMSQDGEKNGGSHNLRGTS